MKKRVCFLLLPIFMILFLAGSIYADEKTYKSGIVSVKLYQNQAKITRSVKLNLKKGANRVVVTSLPKLLYDWSAKGSLPKNFRGKILSMEVEKKALVKKRQKRILDIEEKLMNLREKDQILVDDLKNIKSQEKFLDSILDFTNQTVSKELATRIPQVSLWDKTLNYVSKKKRGLLKEKRKIEKEREDIGKDIQRWEFELSQIAGYSYFRNYQSLNRVTLANRSAIAVQQFSEITDKYAERRRILGSSTGKIDIEKRFIVNIFSTVFGDVDFTVSYIIPNTYWNMLYDVRASNEKKNINMVIYSNIYQKTGEDWNNIELSLSTGAPVNSISPPTMYPWYLDIDAYTTGAEDDEGEYDKKARYKKMARPSRAKRDGLLAEKSEVPKSRIKDKGPFLEITLPLKQTILSSNKYQKKFIQDFKISGTGKINFYYEVIPARVRTGFLRVKTSNSSRLPWLKGEAQIFLENEFMGKINIPYTPVGKKEDIVLGMETRINSRKELVRKFEDSAGVFGGARRILYSYKIRVENQLPQKSEVLVVDVIPVSRNEKIKVEIQNLSRPFLKDGKTEKKTDYARGIRKWKLELAPGEKREITYDVIISFDKDINIRGLR